MRSRDSTIQPPGPGEARRVWVYKRAVSEGVYECLVSMTFRGYARVLEPENKRGAFLKTGEYAETKEGALAEAERLLNRRIQSLESQLSGMRKRAIAVFYLPNKR